MKTLSTSFRFVFCALLFFSSILVIFDHQIDAAATFPKNYDPKEVCFDGLPGYTPNATLATGVYTSNEGFYASAIEPINVEGYRSYPSAVVAICMGYNMTAVTGTSSQVFDIEISLTTLGEWMQGTLADPNMSLTSELSTNAPVGAGQLKLVIAPDSKVTRAVLYRLYEQGVPGFESSAYTLPASVLANPNSSFVSDDDAVIAEIQNPTTAPQAPVGFVSLTRGERIDCAAVSLTNLRGDRALKPSSLLSADPERFKLVPDASLANPNALDISNRVNFNLTFTKNTFDPVYPLISSTFTNIPHIANCSYAPFQNVYDRIIVGIFGLVDFFTADVYTNQLYFWSMSHLPAGMRSLLIADYIDSLGSVGCLPVAPMTAGGSTVVYGLMNKVSLHWLKIKSQTSRYLPSGTNAAIPNTLSKAYTFGGTENFLSASERLANPDVKTWPTLAWSIVVTCNLPGFDSIVISRCDLVDIFRGNIAKWSDPRLAATNPSVRLPDVPITLVIPYFQTVAIEAFLRSLREVDIACTGSSTVVVSDLWTLKHDIDGSSGPDAVAKNRNLAFSLSIAAGPGIVGLTDLIEARLLNTTSGSISDSSPLSIQRSLQNAVILDEETGELDLSKSAISASGYPFIGISNWVMRAGSLIETNSRRSQEQTRALQLALWLFEDPEAEEIIISSGLVPLPEILQQNGLKKISSSSMNGLYIFPERLQNSTSSSLNMPAIIGGAVGGFLFLVIGFSILSWYMGQRNKKSDKHAVKDGKTPMALIFTDIQSSTTLWSVAPQAMAAALDLHNEILDRNIDKYNAYKIKTIGDAYMICCKDVVNAHNMCLDIQRDLYNAEWPSDEIDLAYADLFQTDESPYQLYNPDGTEISYKQRKKIRGYETELYKNRTNPSCYKGIAIRVGMTWGVAEPKLDEVTNAYDYHGPNVNLASRCESCGNGGQTIYSVHAIEALREAGVDLTDAEQLAVTSLGKQPLKGIPAPIELYQILPAELSGRLFPRLRLERDSAMTNELESEENTTTNNTTSALTSTINSTKASDTGSKMSGSNRNTSNASSAPTDDSNEDEYEKQFPVDYRFARVLSKLNHSDPRLLLLAYDAIRSSIAATPNEKTRRGMIDSMCKDWRVQDLRTKQHLFFKKELGYEEYWTLRLVGKCYGQIAQRQRKRPGANEHEINIMRRGMLKGDEFATTATSTDGTGGTGGTFPDAIKVSSTGGTNTGGSNAPMIDGHQQPTQQGVFSNNSGHNFTPSAVRYRSHSSTDGGTGGGSHHSAEAGSGSANNTTTGGVRMNAYRQQQSQNNTNNDNMMHVVPSSTNNTADGGDSVKVESFRSNKNNDVGQL